VADELDLPQHVLRFWETRFSQIRPMKRGGGRRYYRPEDVELLRGIRHLLYEDGYTIKGVQRILKEQGVRHVAQTWGGTQSSAVAVGETEDRFEVHGAPVVDHPHEPVSSEAGPPEVRPSAPSPAAGDAPALPSDALRSLRSVLFELRECRRLLEEARQEP
jgi:DNA-binding transcriptional MerR regulator